MEKDLKAATMLSMMKLAYKTILRDILLDYVGKTDNTLDDTIINIVDAIFGYGDK